MKPEISQRTLLSKIVFWILVIALVGVMWLLGLPKARAGDLYGAVTVHSYHVDRQAKYNEKNYGVGLEYQFDRTFALAAGEYKNSFRVKSTYYGMAYTPFTEGQWKAGVLVLAINGYDMQNARRYIPVAVPLIVRESERVGWNIVFVPPVGNGTGVLGLQAKFKF